MSQIDLINEIIAAAKANNISQGELAARAGIRQETLSRAKKNPNISLKIFADLARIAGLHIKLLPDNPVVDQINDGTLFPS